MITVIPMNDESVAPHFSKALSLAFFNPQGEELFRAPNPALASDCSGKQALIELLEQQKVDRVLVRHIGEQMLARLLDKAFKVFQFKSCRDSVDELAQSSEQELVSLLSASQGSPSLNHEAKHKEGHSCCGHKEHQDKSEKHECCGNKSKWRPQAGHSARHHSRGGRCCR